MNKRYSRSIVPEQQRVLLNNISKNRDIYVTHFSTFCVYIYIYKLFSSCACLLKVCVLFISLIRLIKQVTHVVHQVLHQSINLPDR